MKITKLALGVWFALLAFTSGQTAVDLKNPAITGSAVDGKIRLVIEGTPSLPGAQDKLLFSTVLHQTAWVTRERITQQFDLKFDILQGEAKEFPLALAGEGEIKKVTGDALQDWGVRQEPDGRRLLILRPKKADKPLSAWSVTVFAERELKTWKSPLSILTLTPPQTALFSGYVKVETALELEVSADKATGLLPLEPKFLPEGLRSAAPNPDYPEPLAYQFHGAPYTLPLKIAVADPEMRQVVLRDFKLAGALLEQKAAFELTATARVQNPRGGALTILSGGLALTELPKHPDWTITTRQNAWIVRFEKPGDFPLNFKFHAEVRRDETWSAVNFKVPSGALLPLVLSGLPADTKLSFTGATRPERVGETFTSFLPPDGTVQFAWKTAAPEAEGKLFYSAEMLAQITVAPGLVRQLALLEGRVMQGELDRVTVLLNGAGEVTRVAGDQVLAWKVEPGAAAGERRLVVQFNQPQKSQFHLQIQTQNPLGAFPQTVDALQMRPEGATRFAGYVRIVNQGAVRLEVGSVKGYSQISPEQFPETDATKSAFRAEGTQRFAYRFSGADLAMRIQADQILPELTVSQVLAYHLGENEQTIDAEIELDIREAPLRELLLRVPRGYAVARLNASGLNDYFTHDAADNAAESELRLVYGQPVAGRQIVQLRLERNQALGAAQWVLPRIAVLKAKSVRGHVAASADLGFRLATERTQGLTEIATAFFPRKVAGIQTAFRLSDGAWESTLRVERLPQSVQADAMHLFSIGEGVAYGSSLINYAVSGAPIAALKVELSDEYFNVEFTGKDIRSWQKAEGGFLVQLHTPVTGAYSLLATYERPFKAHGETLAFSGARPLDAQTEQGHTLIISAYQFQVKQLSPTDVSPGLRSLQPAEVPPEYRLFFDEPLLAAYHYSARPFTLKLALSPLAQGDSLSQVVDRAALTTRISKEGQILTDASYFVKSRGNAHFRVALPPGPELWSATVNGAAVTPVKDGKANLIPLPQRADPNAVLVVSLQLAEKSQSMRRARVSTPILGAPVLLTEWTLSPDAAQHLVYRGGSVTPVTGVADVSGFAGLVRMLGGDDGTHTAVVTLAGLALAGVGLGLWRAAVVRARKFSAGFWARVFVGGIALVLSALAFLMLYEQAEAQSVDLPGQLTFLAPVQGAGQALSVEVDNLENETSVWRQIGYAWPVVFTLLFWALALMFRNALFTVLGWTFLAWVALRWPNGANAFLLLVAVCVAWHLLVPALASLWKMPRGPKPNVPPHAGPMAATAIALAFFGLCVSPATSLAQAAAPAIPAASLPRTDPLAERVVQEVRVEEQFALVTAKIHWQAEKGQRLPLLYDPGVVTQVTYPVASLKLLTSVQAGSRTQALLALESGAFDIELKYQVPVKKTGDESGFELPSQYGLVNDLTLTVVNLDVDIVAPRAVSIERKMAGKDTVAKLVLAPENQPWIGWKPRSRDVAREKTVFYAELTQLYTPTAGVIEGLHYVFLRPAQGALAEVTCSVPKGATITDVLDSATLQAADAKAQAPASIVQQWRFDPDTGKLRIALAPAQSRSVTLIVRSQIATAPLPVTHTLGLLSVDNAAGQIGILGMATGLEVQLDSVTAPTLSPINLEDFPGNVTALLAGQIPGITVRRAFRYADDKATADIAASAVEPDVRVESQDTLSLGEDRTLLAVNATVAITRAGVFRLSFALPAGMDIESIEGEALSHWTEAKAEGARIITLHLRGRTMGQQQFTITLAGPGLKATKGWVAPQVLFREAGKQRGTFLVAPEQGMRLQVAKREGLTQLDPQKSGIKQKGVVAFRVLQTPWSLALDIEQVDAWVQVNSLQHASVGEALVKSVINLQYQIENTGLKLLRVALPVEAENVKFTGDQVADFLAVPDSDNEGLRTWEVKLHRRMIGQYLLQATFQTPLAANATEVPLRGVRALDVNLQRGFFTVQSSGRLQLRVDTTPPALQPAEWQSIPRILQKDLTTATASFAYRLVESGFSLAMKLERHPAVELLPARVRSIALDSVVSDNGATLTRVRVELIPGDMRLLNLTVPKGAKFWFAFVNAAGVWPWREGEKILIPLDAQAGKDATLPVTFYYSSDTEGAGTDELDLTLPAPKFDLPLEDITWRVFLNEKWRVKKWTGSLQLEQDGIVSSDAALDVSKYMQGEVAQKLEKSKAAEQMLALGNSALSAGNPEKARKAFESAFGLSQHDNAFNEDARVQLHNLKLQQALVGLNVRNNSVTGAPDPLAGKLRGSSATKDVNYSQQDAKDQMDRNTAEENAAFVRLAERLIQQQDAAINSPAAISATLPEQGRQLVFRRSVAVEKWTDLKIGIEAETDTPASWFRRLLILLGIAVALAVVVRCAEAFRAPEFPSRE